MSKPLLFNVLRRAARCLFLAAIALSRVDAQSSTSIRGRIVDASDQVIPDVEVSLQDLATGTKRTAKSDQEGTYEFPILVPSRYRMTVKAVGFQSHVVEALKTEVARPTVMDFHLQVGDISQQVTVSSPAPLIERISTSVGMVLDQRTVQDIPLNGRYFLDLNLLVPGSVTATQGAFSAAPIRGVGALAINTAGNREESVNYMINGITLNNLTFNAISFQPSIDTIQEFKVDNSTISAEYGHSSGAVINIATRSGSNQVHGELFEFLRNDALDARNFFNFTSPDPPPFQRNQFGGDMGGPLIRNRTFFFASYEGVRQRQALEINSIVLSEAERASVIDPLVQQLLPFIPQANFRDQQGTPRFVGSASAPVNADQWTIDLGHNLNNNDRLHAYYAIQRRDTTDPTRLGNTIPGFGNLTHVRRQILTLNETHTFGPNLVNEARSGFNTLFGGNTAGTALNSADFGIGNGIEVPIGLPQFNIAGGGLNFGGPSNTPSSRDDRTIVFSDTLFHHRGRHSLKMGGEFRHFLGNNFAQGPGLFNFPTIATFLSGSANSFSVTLGDRSSIISQNTFGLFLQDNFRLRANLTFELGMRYECNLPPSERYNRFIVFDAGTRSLLRAGKDFDQIYKTNNTNFEPRIGFAWDPFRDGKTSVRAAYGFLVDEPMTNVVLGTTANPPLAIPLTVTGTVHLSNAIDLARPVGLAPQTVDPNYRNAYLQSWNLNVQREVGGSLAISAGYFGSKGTNLHIARNINQPMAGGRPFPALSEASPILPGTPLANITQIESAGNSSYNALWITASKRLSQGLQFNTSFVWSKSLDYNSFSTQGVVVQNSEDLRGDRGLSDFDARHRFVLSAIYDMPFRGNAFLEGWQLAGIVQAQSGSPINIVTGSSTVNGVANTLRPDVTGPVPMFRRVEQWFDTSVFSPVPRFGTLGRNVIIGPRFDNTDVSLTKITKIGEHMRVQFRAEVFDLFNHANFGPPGRVVGSASFGAITSTRFPTGESGSSRQVQLAVKVMF